MKIFSFREGLFGLGLLALVFVVWLFSRQNPDPLPQFQQQAVVPQEIIEKDWATFVSEEYDFTIKFPKDWNVVVSESSTIPMVSIMKPGEKGTVGEAIDHFENRTHVSIYPRGLPTEGVFAMRRPSSLKLNYQTALANDLVLTTGNAWASEFMFPVTPHSWGPSGFIWARNKLGTPLITCKRGGKEFSESECDPFFGDELIYDADMDLEDRITIEGILRTFSFSEETASTDVRSDVITIASPEDGVRVWSPLAIRGKAQGNWFFEGSFEASIIDANGALVAKGSVDAAAVWDFAITDTIPFSGSISFKKPDSSVGQLILKKANPSGLPEHDDIRRIDILF